MKKAKVLFILKRREDYNLEKHNKIGLTTGLYNSASFMNEMLKDAGIESEIEVVTDNNDIDREVTKHKPTHVIIEALWVIPSKFSILSKLHPNVKWIVRLHSEIPFLANEGMAMDWLGDYMEFPNVYIGANAPRALKEVRFYASHKMGWQESYTNSRILYFPNFYPQEYKRKDYNKDKDYIDISCFGAIRPLKNHVLQAIAAIKFADIKGKKLRFHVNSGRIEMNGSPVLHNLKGLFEQLSEKGHQLINHEWTDREGFLDLCSKMDIGMQCSMTETFNIVGADLISQGVPLIGSKEIPWAINYFCANPVESDEICKALLRTYRFPQINAWSHQLLLKRYTDKTRGIWIDYFTNHI